MKRMISLCLVMAMMFGMVSFIPAFDEKVMAATYGDYTYTETGSEITITKYTGTSDTVTIPSIINEKPVTGIGNDTFFAHASLISVTIPSSATSIGDLAFRTCYNLTSINVDAANANYSSISGVLFNKGATNLIRFPAGMSGTYIIPSSVTSIENFAFSYCTKLTSIAIPSSVTSMGEGAFYNCTNLNDINIPSSVASIGFRSFHKCIGLVSITISNGVTSIGNLAFASCKGITNITIPDSVTSIGNSAFYDCTKLTSITIPSSVTSIASSAFEGCSNFTIITSLGSYAQSYAIANSIPVRDIAAPPPTQTPTPIPTVPPITTWSVSTLDATDITSSGAVIGGIAELHNPSGSMFYLQALALYYWEADNPNNKICVSTLCIYGSGTNIQALECLKSDTLYNFQANIDGKSGQVKSFRTLVAEIETPEPTEEPEPTLTPTPTPTPTATATATPPTVNKTVLGAKIAEAQFLYSAYSGWVYLPENMPAHLSVILGTAQVALQRATVVFNNPEATQAEVDAQVAKLQGVIYLLEMDIGAGSPATGISEESIWRIKVKGNINPIIENKVVIIKGVPLRYTCYNGIYKFVALVLGNITPDDITGVEGTPTQLKYADVNLNGATDATDVNLLKGAVAGNRTAMDSFEFLASDVTGDGAVNTSDYNVLKGFMIGNLVALPVYSK